MLALLTIRFCSWPDVTLWIRAVAPSPLTRATPPLVPPRFLRSMPLFSKEVRAEARSVMPGTSPRVCSVAGPVGVQVIRVSKANRSST
ncbi:hypothetical protein D3C75_1223160 [compost metagenome]